MMLDVLLLSQATVKAVVLWPLSSVSLPSDTKVLVACSTYIHFMFADLMCFEKSGVPWKTVETPSFDPQLFSASRQTIYW